MNDTGRAAALGREAEKMSLWILHKTNHYWHPFYCHNVSSNLLQSSPVSQYCTLPVWSADYADWLQICHLQSPQTDWEWARPERHALTSKCGFKEPQNSTELIFTEVDTMHTMSIWHSTPNHTHTQSHLASYSSKDLKMQSYLLSNIYN